MAAPVVLLFADTASQCRAPAAAGSHLARRAHEFGPRPKGCRGMHQKPSAVSVAFAHAGDGFVSGARIQRRTIATDVLVARRAPHIRSGVPSSKEA